MITDARGRSARVECDVAIAGAGPAGISLALELSRQGLSVALLESGGRDMDPAYAPLTAGESTGYPYHRLTSARNRSFGGTTHLWPRETGWRARPLDEIDFDTRADIADTGWPFGREELWPYYERAMKTGGVVAPSRHVGEWRQDGAFPALPDTADRFRTVSYQWAPPDSFTRHWYTIAESPAIELYLHATVTDIVCDGPADQIAGLRVSTLQGNSFDVRAQMYVLAAGGIENARMLLASRQRHRQGIGNEYDNVGRYFMEHPIWDAAYIVPRDPAWVTEAAAYSSAEANGIAIDRWLSLDEDVMRSEGVLGCAFRFLPEPEPRLTRGAIAAREVVWTRLRAPGRAPETMGQVSALVRSPGDVLRNGWWRARGRPKESLRIKVETQTEQAPNRGSRVALGRKKDAFGLPVASLHWEMQDLDYHTLHRSVGLLGEHVKRTSIGTFVSLVEPQGPHSTPWGGNHQMGTTRMSQDPAKGVVDPDGRVHSLDNLYVAGSSTFPTGGASTPTLTLVALSLRLADHLSERLGTAPEASGEPSTPSAAAASP